MSSKQLESKIKLTTSLDSQGIINGLKDIKQHIKSTFSTDEASFGKLNEYIERIEEEAKKIQQLSAKGLTTKDDVQNLKAMVEQFKRLAQSANNLNSSILSSESRGLSTQITQSKKQIEDFKKKLSSLFGELQRNLVNAEAGISQQMAEGFAKAVRDGAELNDITKQMTANLRQQEQAAKSTLESTQARKKEAEEDLKIQQKSLEVLQERQKALTSRQHQDNLIEFDRRKRDEISAQIAEEYAQLEIERINDKRFGFRTENIQRAQSQIDKQQAILNEIEKRRQALSEQVGVVNWNGQRVQLSEIAKSRDALSAFNMEHGLNITDEIKDNLSQIFGVFTSQALENIKNSLLSRSSAREAYSSFLGSQFSVEKGGRLKKIPLSSMVNQEQLPQINSIISALFGQTRYGKELQNQRGLTSMVAAYAEQIANHPANEVIKARTAARDKQQQKLDALTQEYADREQEIIQREQRLIQALDAEIEERNKTAERERKENEAAIDRQKGKVRSASSKLELAEQKEEAAATEYNKRKTKREEMEGAFNSPETLSQLQKIQTTTENITLTEQKLKELEEKRKRANTEIGDLINQQNIKTKISVSEVYNEVRAMEKLSTVQDKVNQSFDQVFNSILYRFSALSVIRTVADVIKETFSDMRQLDKAFGSIAMVTTKELSELWTQYNQYATIANKLGQSTQSAIEASALYYQQGLQTAEVMQLTESTMKLATLAGQNFSEATKEMTAAIRAFNMEMSEGERITDVYSELAAHAAADVNGIATAMSKVASIAASSGAKFENIAAFLTQIIETTQEAPTNAGTALKTVIARFSEVKENVEDTEIDLENFDINKMDTALKSVGIQLKDDVGQIRAFDQVILELSAIWDTLSRNQQRYLATTAAGSRQQSRFLALMSDNARLNELIEVAQDSAGKSQQQFNKYADTIEYRLNQIKNTWEQFRISLAKQIDFKGYLDSFNEGLQKIIKMPSTYKLAIVAAFTVLGKSAATGFFNGLKGSTTFGLQLLSGFTSKVEQKIVSAFGKTSANGAILQALADKNLFTAQGHINEDLFNEKGIIKTAQNINQTLGREYFSINSTGNKTYISLDPNNPLTESEQAHIIENAQNIEALAKQRSQIYANVFSQNLLTAISNVALKDQWSDVFFSTLGIGAANSALQAATQAASTLARGMGTAAAASEALATGGFSLLISAGVALTAMTVKGIQQLVELGRETEALKNESYQAAKALETLKAERESLQKELQKKQNTLDQAKSDYEDIKKDGERLKELQSQILLTSEEKEEMASLSQNIANQMPELITSYNEEGIAILDLTDKYEKLIDVKRQAYGTAKQEEAETSIKLAFNEYQDIQQEEKRIVATQKELLENEYIQDFVNNRSAIETLPFNGGPEMEGVNTSYTATPLERLWNIVYDKSFNQIFKQILENNADFDIADVEDDKIIESVIKSIKEEADEEEKTKKTIKLQKAVQKYIDKTVDFTSQYLQNQLSLSGGIDDLIYGVLVQNPEYEKTDKATQAAIERYVRYKAAGTKSIPELMTQWEGQLRERGITDENKIKEGINQYLENYLAYTEEAIKKVSYEDIFDTSWQKITKEIANMPLNEATEIVIKHLGEESEEVAAWISYNKEGIEAANANAKKIAEAWGLTLKSSMEDQIVTFDKENLFGQVFSKLSASAQDRLIENLNQAEEGGYRQKVIELIKDMSADLTEKDLASILTIDTDNYSIEKANSIWKDLSANAQKYRQRFERLFINQSFSSTEVANNLQSHLQDSLKNSIYAALQKAMTAQIKEGYVDSESLAALMKAGIKLSDIYGEDNKINKELAETYLKNETQNLVDVTQEYQKQFKLKKAIINSAKEELAVNGKIEEARYREYLILNGIGEKEATNMASQISYGGYVYTETLKEQLEAMNDEEAEFEKVLEAIEKSGESLFLNWVSNIAKAESDAAESAEKDAEKIEKAAKSVKDAYEDIIEKQEALAEAQKKLNDTLYGSEFRKSSQDGLYNYQLALDQLNETIEEIKENLEDFDGSPKEMIEQLFSASRNKAIYLGAQNDRYNAAINSTYNSLVGQVNNYMKTIGNGSKYNVSDFFNYNSIFDRYEINQSALNAAQFNDNLKGFIEDQIDLLNQYKKNIQENNKEIKNTEKELEEYKKKARDNYLSVEEEIVKKLEEFYKKEIEDKKEMYDALAEADNDYLDALQKAIDKQRRLRDQQDKWNELSTKEKKLSLLQRDTSGANQKDVLKLQKEIQKDRTSMLDSVVDNIINDLKELYETQKETREEELKYQESIVENSSYVAEANALMQSWKSLDDMRAWMWEHTEGIENMSDAAVEKLTDDWKTMFNNIQIYNELQQKNVKENFDNTSEKVKEVVLNTSDMLVGEADRAFGEIKESVDEAIKDAQKAVENAMKALAEAQEKYNEALKEQNRLLQEQAEVTAALAIEWKKLRDDEDKPYYYLYGNARDEAIKSIAQALYGSEDKESVLSQYSDLAPSILSEAKEVAERKESKEVILEQVSKIFAEGEYSKALDLYSNYDDIYYDVIKNAIYDQLKNVFPNESDNDLMALAEGKIISSKFNRQDLFNAGLPTARYTGKIPGSEPIFYYALNGTDLDNMIRKDAPNNSFNIRRYSKGGPIDYTGLAYVDGSKYRPEYILNSEDTMRIGQAASILRDAAEYTHGNITNISTSPNIRESNTEIHIHVDSIATESQVDYLIDKIKDEIVDAANPIGSSVILR